MDSNEYIFGLAKTSKYAEILLKKAEKLNIFISRMIVSEITRNLSEINYKLVKDFFHLLNEYDSIEFIEYRIPLELIHKYVVKGFKEPDATIGAFTEWVGAHYLISENRHFLKEVTVDEFEIIDAKEYLDRIED